MQLFDLNVIRDKAFRTIVNDKEKWAKWNDCKSQEERDNMMFIELYRLGFEHGYVTCTIDVCDKT